MPPLSFMPPLIETKRQTKKKTLGEVFAEMEAQIEEEKAMFSPRPLSPELEVLERSRQAREALDNEDDSLA